MRYSKALSIFRFTWCLMVRWLVKNELWRRWPICGRLLASNPTFVCSVWDNLWETSVIGIVSISPDIRNGNPSNSSYKHYRASHRARFSDLVPSVLTSTLWLYLICFFPSLLFNSKPIYSCSVTALISVVTE